MNGKYEIKTEDDKLFFYESYKPWMMEGNIIEWTTKNFNTTYTLKIVKVITKLQASNNMLNDHEGGTVLVELIDIEHLQ